MKSMEYQFQPSAVEQALKADKSLFARLSHQAHRLRNHGIAWLLAGLVLVGFNFYQMRGVMAAVPHFWTYHEFWQLFFSARTAHASWDFGVAFYTYGGPLALLVGIILLARGLRGADQKRLNAAYRRFVEAGSVLIGSRLKIPYTSNKTTYYPIFFTTPGSDPAPLQAWLADLQQQLIQDKHTLRKALKKPVAAAGSALALGQRVAPAAQFFDDAPTGSLVAMLSTITPQTDDLYALWPDDQGQTHPVRLSVTALAKLQAASGMTSPAGLSPRSAAGTSGPSTTAWGSPLAAQPSGSRLTTAVTGRNQVPSSGVGPAAVASGTPGLDPALVVTAPVSPNPSSDPGTESDRDMADLLAFDPLAEATSTSGTVATALPASLDRATSPLPTVPVEQPVEAASPIESGNRRKTRRDNPQFL